MDMDPNDLRSPLGRNLTHGVLDTPGRALIRTGFARMEAAERGDEDPLAPISPSMSPC